MAWLTGWAYRKKLTSDHTLIDSDLSGFPAFVKLTAGNFDFTKAMANGYDIRLTKADGITLLDFERERHDNAGEKAEYHFNTVTISSSVDQDFYLYYGKAGATNGENITAVWDSNFKGVWHLREDPSGGAPQMLDSTSNNNDGTSYGSMTSGDQVEGIVNGNLDFDTDDYIDVGDGASLEISPKITVSALIKVDSYANFRGVVGKWNETGDNRVWALVIFSTGYLYWYICSDGTDIVGRYDSINNGVAIGTGVRKYIAGIFDGDIMRLRVDDAEAANKNTVLAALYTGGTAESRIGSAEQFGGVSGNYYDGEADEIRISDIDRSAAWEKATYNSLFDNLLTFGVEEEEGDDGGGRAFFLLTI